MSQADYRQKINILIAEHVVGLALHNCDLTMAGVALNHCKHIPHYSTDIKAAFEAARSFIERHMSISVSILKYDPSLMYQCEIAGIGRDLTINSDSEAMALCEAILSYKNISLPEKNK